MGHREGKRGRTPFQVRCHWLEKQGTNARYRVRKGQMVERRD